MKLSTTEKQRLLLMHFSSLPDDNWCPLRLSLLLPRDSGRWDPGSEGVPQMRDGRPVQTMVCYRSDEE